MMGKEKTEKRREYSPNGRIRQVRKRVPDGRCKHELASQMGRLPPTLSTGDAPWEVTIQSEGATTHATGRLKFEDSI